MLKKINVKKNNLVLNILYIKEMEICPVYVSKINSNCEKQKIFLMIPNKEIEGCDYLPVKKLFALLRGITSKIMVFFLFELSSLF